MYCRKCGKQLDDSVKFCPVCGEATGVPPVQQFRQPDIAPTKPPFQTWFLVSGIITIVFAGIMGALSGCASALGAAVGNSDAAIEAKFATSILSLVCGIVSVATRKRVDCKGAIAVIILGLWSAFMALDPVYQDIGNAVWMFICAAVAGVCVYRRKRS